MVMSIIMTPPPMIFLLMLHGVYSADDGWGVTYSSSHICALKDSTVTINCTYKYPPKHKITQVFWTKVDSPDAQDLSKDSEYSERIKYLGDKQRDCSVRLTDVRETDSHKYYFRFITDKDKWTGTPGVILDVTDLQVESEGERVMEGHSVTLTCKSRCSLSDTSTFIWFRNTQTLNDRNKKLILPSVRRENAGDYRCAVQGHNLTSPPRRLNVIYPPDKPVISISSSGVIVEGDSVNLTCSSESNPPVDIYSWFKENQTSSVGSGNIYIISNIRSDHSGQYKCKTENELGQNNSTVTLNVLYPPRSVTASISSSGVIVEGDSVNLTCSSESNPPVHSYSWFKENQTSSVGSGNIYIISNIRSDHSGQYKCKTENELGQNNSTVTLNVLYPPRSVTASISSSGVIVEGDSVNLTCSSESNPPVHIYSWFKETQTSSVGSGQMFSISNFNSSLSGWFYCVAQNEVGSHRSAAVSLTLKGNMVMFYSIIGALTFGAAFVVVFLLVWRIRWMKKRNESRIDHHSPPNDSNKTSDTVYENVMIADDGGDDSDSSSPDYENVTGSFRPHLS